VKAEDVATNELIPAINSFDKAKVKADAEAYPLSEAMAAVDVDAIKAHLFDQAIAS
jgi:NitT/TauT family transport system substrate-binding protein